MSACLGKLLDDEMKAMRLFQTKKAEDHPLQMVDVPAPTAGKGQIRITMLTCGICHTDLHIAEGELKAPKLPITLGHQAVGMIDQIGEGVSGFAMGEKVGAPWLALTCGKCEFCRRGEENLCRFIQFHGLHVDGGFAEKMLLNADFAVKLPIKLNPVEIAPLLCAGIVGYRSVKLADIKSGDTVGMIGFGASAHLSMQVIKSMGSKVFVFTRAKIHKELALRLGADWAGDLSDISPAMCDRIIQFAPAGNLVPAAFEKLSPGGSLLINAVTMSDIPSFPYSMIYGERTIKSVANATRQDAVEFMDWVSKHDIQVITNIYTLPEANRALVDLKISKINGEAVIQF
jgi:alcohol dehydrogenase, propanol-preferring